MMLNIPFGGNGHEINLPRCGKHHLCKKRYRRLYVHGGFALDMFDRITNPGRYRSETFVIVAATEKMATAYYVIVE